MPPFTTCARLLLCLGCVIWELVGITNSGNATSVYNPAGLLQTSIFVLQRTEMP